MVETVRSGRANNGGLTWDDFYRVRVACAECMAAGNA